MKVHSWRIFYGDGLIVDSHESSWELAPADNIQVVILFHQETYQIRRDGQLYTEPYRTVLHSQDYYWQKGNRYGAGAAKHVPKSANVKLGKWVDRDRWREIYNRAHADMDSPNGL